MLISGYININNIEGYIIGTTPVNSYAAANAYCNSQGSELATILDATDQAAAQALCSANANYDPLYGCFIGLRHKDATSEWEWKDGSSLSLYGFNADGSPATGTGPWLAGEPNNNNEDCVHLLRYGGFAWNDHPCSGYYNLPMCNDPGI